MSLVAYYRNARKTCLEMFEDRGYTVPKYLHVVDQEFEDLFSKSKLDMMGVTDNQGKPVYVHFTPPTRSFNTDQYRKDALSVAHDALFGPSTGKTDIQRPFDRGEARLVIAFNAKAGTRVASRLKLENEYLLHPYIEVFQVRKLSINPTRHVYQSNHKLIRDPAEIKEIYQTFSATPALVQSICVDDPVNRYYGGRPATLDRLADIYQINQKGRGITIRKVVSRRMNIK